MQSNMALFGKKATKEPKTTESEKKEEKVVAEESKATTPALSADRDLASVIIQPRITEKAALAIDSNVYTFEIQKDATKHAVRDAIQKLYNVTPVKIRIVNKKPRHYTSRMRGRTMMEKGLKKAYVYLKKGDRIDLV